MRKKAFYYFLTIGILIELGFYLSDGWEREKEEKGFVLCWSNSHIKGRPEWRSECHDLHLMDQVKQYLKDVDKD